jgi:hypothetical protein
MRAMNYQDETGDFTAWAEMLGCLLVGLAAD